MKIVRANNHAVCLNSEGTVKIVNLVTGTDKPQFRPFDDICVQDGYVFMLSNTRIMCYSLGEKRVLRQFRFSMQLCSHRVRKSRRKLNARGKLRPVEYRVGRVLVTYPKRFISGNYFCEQMNGTARIWKFAMTANIELQAEPVMDIGSARPRLAIRGERLFVANKEGRCSAFNLNTLALEYDLDLHGASVYRFAFMHNLVFCGCFGGNMMMFDVDTGVLAYALSLAGQTVTSIAFNSTCMFVATTALLIYVFDLRTFKLLRTLKGHDQTVHKLVATETFLLSASRDKTVARWDLETFKPVSIHDTLSPLNDVFIDEHSFGYNRGEQYFTHRLLSKE